MNKKYYKTSSTTIELVHDIINMVMQEPTRKETLVKALERNESLTATYELGFFEMDVYQEGFYLTLNGTRCSYSIYAKDIDGELELTRKPRNLQYSHSYSGNTYYNWR